MLVYCFPIVPLLSFGDLISFLSCPNILDKENCPERKWLGNKVNVRVNQVKCIFILRISRQILEDCNIVVIFILLHVLEMIRM